MELTSEGLTSRINLRIVFAVAANPVAQEHSGIKSVNLFPLTPHVSYAHYAWNWSAWVL
jgi:hypothetical protein